MKKFSCGVRIMEMSAPGIARMPKDIQVGGVFLSNFGAGTDYCFRSEILPNTKMDGVAITLGPNNTKFIIQSLDSPDFQNPCLHLSGDFSIEIEEDSISFDISNLLLGEFVLCYNSGYIFLGNDKNSVPNFLIIDTGSIMGGMPKGNSVKYLRWSLIQNNNGTVKRILHRAP